MELIRDAESGAVIKPLRRLGKYELIQRLAAGGMAEVYLALLRGPMNFQKVVVVKVIHPHLAQQEEFLRMLLDEARVSALIKHPRVVDIYELGHEEGVYFIAMEHLESQPLSAVISAGITNGPLDPLSIGRIMADAAEGLHAAHELKSSSGGSMGLVHRDVSPGNIMVLYDGSVKIVDFGIAKARGRLTVSGVRQFKGKVGYVAPEQITGGVVDRRTDVFALGVVMWETLCSKRLFQAESESASLQSILERQPPSPTSVRDDVPEELSAICLRALSPFPEYRFQTAGEMQRAIEDVLKRHGYYRESGIVAEHMNRLFAKQKEVRQRSVRMLGHVTTTGFDVPIDIDLSDDDDYPDIQVDKAGKSGAIELASGTPVLPTEPVESLELLETQETVPEKLRSTLTPRAVTPVPTVTGAVLEEPDARPSRKLLWYVLAILLLAGAAFVGRDLLKRLQAAREDKPVAARAKAPARSKRAAKAPATGAAPAEAAEAKPDEAPAGAAPEGAEAAVETSEAPTPGATSDSGSHRRSSRRDHDEKDQDEEDKPAEAAKTAAQLYDEGAAHFVSGATGQAKQRFTQALAINRRHAPSHRGLGLVYLAEGNKAKARKYFERYLELSPNASDAAAIKKRIDQLK